MRQKNEVSEIEFQKITKEDKNIFDNFLRLTQHENSSLNFTNFYMWRKFYDTHWAVKDNVLYVVLKNQLLQPFCAEEKIDDAIHDAIKIYRDDFSSENIFHIAEENFVERLKNFSGAEFEFFSDRNRADYVYNTEDLIKLAGRKFHRKKNHLNSFNKCYPHAEYISLETQDAINLCIDCMHDWYNIRDLEQYPALKFERDAILDLFADFKYFDVKGGAILIDGKAEAFAIGEQITPEMSVVHIEKGDTDFNGIYAAINQKFAANEWSEMKFINREEDLGIEGIRKTKEAYRPVKMIEKFEVKLKSQ